ncbi:metal/formaldehyde-sensitive transcriptional repressor [Sphingomonas alpina]|uniref:Metal/formaldehyde-sensitive transcriptional repressor n=1 Tax=Sphingomonas alpina TaxID=653931 RepID=A0A7H0LLY5_9SPHN|nr:metal/formaldehyde-sensitive transcriptional repressor [Sphingomonas alpina]QNQ10688.1 metal/formaldehyde-sensitive transcriptional repressor [Sphingomonas alpina]
MAHLTKDNEALTNRVKRIAGQVDAIDRALASSASCASILHLVAATRGAINGLMEEIIDAYLREHVAGPDLSDTARAEGADELLAAIRRYAK